MAASDIITGQFVRISQTPASIGDRIMARIIDMIVIVLYVLSASFMIFNMPSSLSGLGDKTAIVITFAAYLPAIFYSFLCETFNNGQTFGKRIMKTRVVKAGGSTPGIGDFLMRWMLLLADLHISCIGLIAIICTKKNQRFGDLAAGTLVIKQKEYKKMHISLDEFSYARKDYCPVYPEAARLSSGQIEIIRKALQGSDPHNAQQAARLSKKIQDMLGIKPDDNDDRKFLTTLMHDYQYYVLELI